MLRSKPESNPDLLLHGIGHYSFVKSLGEGKFSRVKLAKHYLTGKEVAIKIIDRHAHQPRIIEKLYREVYLMTMARGHSSVVEIQRVYSTRHSLMLVMEYVPGWNLQEFIDKFAPNGLQQVIARNYFRQIVDGVAWCHSRGIIHRDLKTQNILVHENGKEIKIADFGLGNVFNPRVRLRTWCGSLMYYSPEIVSHASYYGPEIDNWCLGVILYRMTTGCDPFGTCSTIRALKTSICQGSYVVPDDLPPDLATTIRKLMCVDPASRMSLKPMMTSDPWITGEIGELFTLGTEKSHLSSDETLYDPYDDTASPFGDDSSYNQHLNCRRKFEYSFENLSLYPLSMLLDDEGIPTRCPRLPLSARVRGTAGRLGTHIFNLHYLSEPLKIQSFGFASLGLSLPVPIWARKRLMGYPLECFLVTRAATKLEEVIRFVESALTLCGNPCRFEGIGQIIYMVARPKKGEEKNNGRTDFLPEEIENTGPKKKRKSGDVTVKKVKHPSTTKKHNGRNRGSEYHCIHNQHNNIPNRFQYRRHRLEPEKTSEAKHLLNETEDESSAAFPGRQYRLLNDRFPQHQHQLPVVSKSVKKRASTVPTPVPTLLTETPSTTFPNSAPKSINKDFRRENTAATFGLPSPVPMIVGAPSKAVTREYHESLRPSYVRGQALPRMKTCQVSLSIKQSGGQPHVHRLGFRLLKGSTALYVDSVARLVQVLAPGYVLDEGFLK